METRQKMMRDTKVFEFSRPEVLKFYSDIAIPILKDHQKSINNIIGVAPYARRNFSGL
uniref:Uncharacterized protein n=1 Tax=Moschus moschiferus TaxID=68415 RepID=A0A8C6G305_MOSMO